MERQSTSGALRLLAAAWRLLMAGASSPPLSLDMAPVSSLLQEGGLTARRGRTLYWREEAPGSWWYPGCCCCCCCWKAVAWTLGAGLGQAGEQDGEAGLFVAVATVVMVMGVGALGA
jgi:hypothetical protein